MIRPPGRQTAAICSVTHLGSKGMLGVRSGPVTRAPRVAASMATVEPLERETAPAPANDEEGRGSGGVAVAFVAWPVRYDHPQLGAGYQVAPTLVDRGEEFVGFECRT